MANKIKFGISKLYYVPITSTAPDGTVTYDNPVAWPGAVSLSLDASGSTNPFYADNVIYWQAEASAGYEGDLEVALIPDSFRTDILGETLDAKGFYIEQSSSVPKEFALLFQFEGDESATRHCFYRCTCTRPSVSGTTKEDTIEPQTETVTLTAMGRINDTVVKSRCPYTSSTSSSYALWFTAVQEPTTA